MDNDEENDDMCEKILQKIQTIINEDDVMGEFSIGPSEDSMPDRNVCPVRHLWQHWLNLDAWCVPYVLRYAKRCIFSQRRKGHTDALSMNKYLNGALLIQADVTTFWNIKRELIADLDIDIELRFSALVLSNSCKALEAYSYRRFLIERKNIPLEDERDFFSWEVLRVLHLAVRGTPNNYHAWNHRIWCFQRLATDRCARDELTRTKKAIGRNVSDHSCFHYRQFILNRFKSDYLLNESELDAQGVFDSCDTNSNLQNLNKDHLERNGTVVHYEQYLRLLDHELYTVLAELHSLYPGHETLWYHRRYAIKTIYETLCQVFGVELRPQMKISHSNIPNDVNIVVTTLNPSDINNGGDKLIAMQSSEIYKSLLSKEREFLRFNSANNDQWKLNDLDLQHVYENWLIYVLGFTL